MSEPLRYDFDSKTIQVLRSLQHDGTLNLEPGFQRQSVWSPADRRKLVQSILQGLPIPSIFLYRREENGWPVYDVIDGKQRLETIFMFSRERGFGRQAFDVRLQLDGDDQPYWWDWNRLKKREQAARLLTYRIPTVEVSGDLSDIVDLFVRINSTGKALTGAERRHARFYTSPFLREAERLARRFRKYFLQHRILAEGQIQRMKDVELVSELLASVATGGPIDQKTAIDRAIGNSNVNAHTLRKASKELQAAFRVLRRIFPELRMTRFRNSSEFYSLILLVWQMQRQNLVLRDRRRNRTAQKLLRQLSNGVDEVRDLQRRAKGAGRGHAVYAEYLTSVQQGTDKLTQRKLRAEVLGGIFVGLFARKDNQRMFSPELRRLLWNSEERKMCSDCTKPLTWNNFQVDHILPHALGGRASRSNARLVCGSCNARKGARHPGGRGARAA